MRVLKFGGACLVSPERIGRVVDAVRRTEGRRLVVVSAVAGVTDRLHAVVAQIERNAPLTILDELEEMHRSLAPETYSIDSSIRAILADLAYTLGGRSHGVPLGASERERVISTGERLAAVLVAAHLEAACVPSEVFSSERAGIRCDGKPGAASIDASATDEGSRLRLLPVIDRGIVPVVTGYYGVTSDGRVATFGRSGTDYTASALAASLGAERVEMWKVVGGFLNADPELFPDAHVIPRLSYEEAAELAFYGAKVMHPRALGPVRDAGIPIHIVDLEEPDGAGSWIGSEPSNGDQALTAMSARRGLSMLRFLPSTSNGHQETTEIAQALASSGVNVLNTTTAQTSLGILIEACDTDQALAIVERLNKGRTECVELISDLALLCAVGHGIGHTRGLVGRLLCSIVRAGIDVEMVCAGASAVACHVTISEEQVEAASAAIYGEFFARRACPDRRLCLYPHGGRRHQAEPAPLKLAGTGRST